MEFKFRATGNKASSSSYIPPPPSSSPGLSYFAEQALRANYMGPNLARVWDFLPNPRNVRESFMWELEKQQIREEFIAAEVARRSALEAEVRGEMMLAREFALRDACSHDKSIFSRPTTLVRTPRLPISHRSEGRPLEVLPSDHISEPKITEVNSSPEISKERIIYLPKPEGNVSGVKRKAMASSATSATISSLTGTKKKLKEDLRCELCQVSATSEQALKEHLQGKKHKSREARQFSQATEKIGMGLGKAVKSPDTLSEITRDEKVELSEKMKEEALKEKSNEKCGKLKDDVALNEGGSSKKKEKDSMKFTFWCQMCKIGAFSEKVMNSHKKSKKHMSRLLEALSAQIEGSRNHNGLETVVDKAAMLDNMSNGEALGGKEPTNCGMENGEMENHQGAVDDVVDGGGSDGLRASSAGSNNV